MGMFFNFGDHEYDDNWPPPDSLVNRMINYTLLTYKHFRDLKNKFRKQKK